MFMQDINRILLLVYNTILWFLLIEGGGGSSCGFVGSVHCLLLVQVTTTSGSATHLSRRRRLRPYCSKSASTNNLLRSRILNESKDKTMTSMITNAKVEGKDGDASGGGGGGEQARWCPEQQIYVGGTVPHHSEDVQALLDDSNLNDGDGSLYVFGYGSLCWNPGTGVLGNPLVTTQIGFAHNYQRIWGQKSTDHRGTVSFPGIVCTLLKSSEVDSIVLEKSTCSRRSIRTGSGCKVEGRLFRVPKELVEECLQELDFREKGGYSRDVIDVEVLSSEQNDATTSQTTQKALLYRGTVDNPAFWPRVLLDLKYAAAVISVAVGPSGPNNKYLTNLDDFLELSEDDHIVTNDDNDDDTKPLARLLKECNHHHLYFLFGGGSNQHNQLLLRGCCRPNTIKERGENDNDDEEDVHEQTEILLTTRKKDDHDDPPAALFAGGGHSGLLTISGNLYLFGWNDFGQCGSSPKDTTNTSDVVVDTMKYDNMRPLSEIEVETASLGFAHTLVIEKTTRRLFAFGDNRNGQVTGQKSTNDASSSSSSFVDTPTTPEVLNGRQISKIAAGVYHSAVITADGSELISFGGDEEPKLWSPPDGAPLMHVACGRKHTVVVDDQNRVWTGGENKYGQLGRATTEKKDLDFAVVESLNDGISNHQKIIGVYCGWSHTIVLVENTNTNERICYGWGRNDLGQLGTSVRDHVHTPQRIFIGNAVERLDCGSESTMAIIDGKVYGCGWNEHGNLSTGTQTDALVLTPAVGTPVVSPLDYSESNCTSFSIAVGGAHYLASKTIS